MRNLARFNALPLKKTESDVDVVADARVSAPGEDDLIGSAVPQSSARARETSERAAPWHQG